MREGYSIYIAGAWKQSTKACSRLHMHAVKEGLTSQERAKRRCLALVNRPGPHVPRLSSFRWLIGQGSPHSQPVDRPQ